MPSWFLFADYPGWRSDSRDIGRDIFSDYASSSDDGPVSNLGFLFESHTAAYIATRPEGDIPVDLYSWRYCDKILDNHIVADRGKAMHKGVVVDHNLIRTAATVKHHTFAQRNPAG